MGNPKGFIEIPRKEAGYRPVKERTGDFSEVEQTLNTDDRKMQASRCMDCGVAFCHWGCPVGSKIPEWQDSIYRGDWEEAVTILHETNNFPEFTGSICPAPCEKSCVLAINNEAVTIRENEASVVDKAFEMGLIKPRIISERTGKRIAVVGSGPAGLSVAAQLNRAGHEVTLFEKDEAVGGILRYGIPDFKMNKHMIDRRMDIFLEEGLVVKTGVMVGKDIQAAELSEQFDAVCLAIGSMNPRDLNIKGRNLQGVHFAMDFLTQQNRVIAGLNIPNEKRITAKGKHVVVIGGGDTGADCVGTAIRQQALYVTQIEIMPEPPKQRAGNNPWPYWPDILRISSSHQEGCKRLWSAATRKFVGKNGILKGIIIDEVLWTNDNDKKTMEIISGEGKHLEADLVLLAMGFDHPIHEGLVKDLGLELDNRGNIKINETGQTSQSNFFAVGDAVLGASLVVKAIASGRQIAEKMNYWLQNKP